MRDDLHDMFFHHNLHGWRFCVGGLVDGYEVMDIH